MANMREFRSLPTPQRGLDMLANGDVMPIVYMAGKMVLRHGGGGDNKIPGRSYRPFDILNDALGDDAVRSPLELRLLCGEPFLYAGPWQARGGYHGLIHGITDCGSVDEHTILARAKHGIEQCDVFFALLDGLDCYGTLVEIGYAQGLGKPVIIGVEGGAGEDPRWGRGFPAELWFAITAADVRLFGRVADILQQFAAILAVPRPPARRSRPVRPGRGVLAVRGPSVRRPA